MLCMPSSQMYETRHAQHAVRVATRPAVNRPASFFRAKRSSTATPSGKVLTVVPSMPRPRVGSSWQASTSTRFRPLPRRLMSSNKAPMNSMFLGSLCSVSHAPERLAQLLHVAFGERQDAEAALVIFVNADQQGDHLARRQGLRFGREGRAAPEQRQDERRRNGSPRCSSTVSAQSTPFRGANGASRFVGASLLATGVQRGAGLRDEDVGLRRRTHYGASLTRPTSCPSSGARRAPRRRISRAGEACPDRCPAAA
jgi:hypothetical protein